MITIDLTSNVTAPAGRPSGSGGARFWAWAGVRLTAGGFMAGHPAS
jgi:hypothetical protein